MPTRFRPALLGLMAITQLATFPLTAAGESSTTVPVGVMRYTFPATTQVTTTYISMPLTNAAVYSARVTAVGANTITFAGAPFTAGELALPGSPFFAKIASGAQVGRTIRVTANTANVLTLDTTDNSSQTVALNAAGWAMAEGDRVEVIVGDTLASFFGDGSEDNPLKLVGSTSSLTSDNVGFYNKSTGKIESYYFNTTLGHWRSTTNALNRNDSVLFPEAAINITRRGGRPAISLSVIGSVPEGEPLTKVTGGTTTVFTGSRYPVDVTLGQLSFSNWNKGLSPLNSDSISLYNPTTGRFDAYYQRSDNNQWIRVGGGSVDRSNQIIPAGSGMNITKRGIVSAESSMLSTNMPYSLSAID